MPEMGEIAIDTPGQRREQKKGQCLASGMRCDIAIERTGRAGEMEDFINGVEEQDGGDDDVDIFAIAESDLVIADVEQEMALLGIDRPQHREPGEKAQRAVEKPAQDGRP